MSDENRDYQGDLETQADSKESKVIGVIKIEFPPEELKFLADLRQWQKDSANTEILL